MIKIENKDMLKEISKYMYDVNQIYKNIYKGRGKYTIKDKKIYCGSPLQFPQMVVGEMNTDLDFFDNKTFCVDGQELFKFDPKKTKAEENEDGKKIRVLELNSIEYNEENNHIKWDKGFDFIEEDYDSYDIDYYEDFIHKISKFDDLIGEYEIGKETLELFYLYPNLSIKVEFLDDFKEGRIIPIYLNKKFLVGNTKKIKTVKKEEVIEYSPGYANIYQSNDEELSDYFLFEIEFKDKLINTKQYFIICGTVEKYNPERE